MLVLGVRSGEYITIGQDIVIQVVKAGEVTRLAVQAPRECPVVRGKLVESSGGAPDCIRNLPIHQDSNRTGTRPGPCLNSTIHPCGPEGRNRPGISKIKEKSLCVFSTTSWR